MKKVFSSFSRLKSIPCSDPELTPGNWCTIQPCRKVSIGSREFTLTQPTSTFFVYFLGVLTIGAGLYFLIIRGLETSRLWWGISLLLWGIGALLAGTSYQAFAFEIKCAGRQSCSWTSWWEVVYLIFQQVSMNALLIGIAYSCTAGTWQTLLLVFALVSSLLYTVIVFIGALIPIKSLLTFSLMVWVSIPVLLICLFVNGWRYYHYGDPMDLALLGTWLSLLLTSAIYWLYDELDVTTKLWKKGIWFSQNDILHVCLIFWAIYIATVVAHRIQDYTPPVLPG